MNKVFILVAVFVIGCVCGYQYSAAPESPSVLQASSSETEKVSVEPLLSETLSPQVATHDSPEELVKLLSVQTPKTQFESYRAFQKLDRLAADEIINILVSLDESQLQLKAQISWFLSGKFPEQSFALMESSMGDNQMPLAQILFANLTVNQPEKLFDWLQNNENDFAILYPVAEHQLDRKMGLYRTLSAFPDWKWAAYEAGMALVKDSLRPQDKWSSRGLAQAAAQANPQEAINYALAQHSGAVDGSLLNGALVEYAKTNPLEAKDLLLQNQSYADAYTADSLIDNLLSRGHFVDAYSLANSLQDKKIVESVVINTAGKVHSYGSEKVMDFIATISDAALKVKAVSSATNAMSVAGYPVEKQLEVMDAGLRNVSVEAKAFNYAWTLKNGYKNDPQALTVYLSQMRFNNKALAEEVEKALGYMKDS